MPERPTGSTRCSSTSPKTRQSTLGRSSDKSSTVGWLSRRSPMIIRSIWPLEPAASAASGCFSIPRYKTCALILRYASCQCPRTTAGLEHNARIRGHKPQQIGIDAIVIVRNSHRLIVLASICLRAKELITGNLETRFVCTGERPGYLGRSSDSRLPLSPACVMRFADASRSGF